ncbi:PREDICTED: pumilio homolog 18-like [Brassica oleracea var. oleracea]|uniref:pumilio homolog 18-like n=1 Tax=Brassica oleracea var. oleracea TaxID=109376 RepID=UPI0006A72414|nr:PREDICTED: pumilio homolog 18-like [Brassica oleracea var. oleracea]
MAPDNNPFSMSTMSNALQHIRGFAPRASDVPDTRLKRLFNLMTSCEGVGQFKDLTSTFDQSQLQMMASLLTSDSEYFMEVASNKYGSRRVQKLLGISDDVDAFFYATQKILQRFFDIMTDKYASYVAIRATVVFDQVKKHVMYKYVLHYALDIARKQHGCIALNEVLTDADDPLYRNRLLDVVARDALFLSNDPWGNFVVQIHVLKLYDLRCTYHVAVSLRGHCVDLSFKKYGSYIVEKLLEAEVSMGMVVVELLKCDGDRLMRLARSEFGNFVVLKALNVTQEMNRVDLFWDLVQKLMPLRHLLLRSHGSNIANVLESCSKANRTKMNYSFE